MARNQCTICDQGAETAQTINELLAKKTPVREIQAQTGINKSTVNRHANGACRFSFAAYKAARIKSKSKAPNLDGRLVVFWPEHCGKPAHFSCYGRVLGNDDLRHDDIVVGVIWEHTPVARVGNPRAWTFNEDTSEEFLALALAEDAAHTSKI